MSKSDTTLQYLSSSATFFSSRDNLALLYKHLNKTKYTCNMQYCALFISRTIRKHSFMVWTSRLRVFLLPYPVFCFIASFVSLSNFRAFFAFSPHFSITNFLLIPVSLDVMPYNSLSGTTVRVSWSLHRYCRREAKLLRAVYTYVSTQKVLKLKQTQSLKPVATRSSNFR